jgi:hypothetical protein
MKHLATLTAIGLCLAAPAFAQTTPEQEQLNRQRATTPSTPPPAAAQVPPGQSAPAAASQPQSATGTQAQPAQSGQAQNQQPPAAAGGSSGSAQAPAPAPSNPPSSASSNRNPPAQNGQAQNQRPPAASGSSSGSAQAPASQNRNAAQPSTSTSVNVNINDTQRTRIAEVVSSANIRPIDVRFRVETGVAVPATVTLHPLPPRIVEIVPQYRSYRYFVTRDRIVIVEPAKKTIVAVIPNGSGARAAAPAPAANKVTFTEQQREVIRKRTSATQRPATTGSGSARIAIEQEVPATIELQEFPAEIVTEVPAVKTYRYYQQDNDVVVVDPTQRRVIEIIR